MNNNISGKDQHFFYHGLLQGYLNSSEFINYLTEIMSNRELLNEFESQVSNVSGFTQCFSSVLEFRLYRTLLYSLIRAVQPEIVLETGVLHGMTSAFLLEALSQNKTGKLISVDLPSYYVSGPANQDGIYATLPKNKEPGWFVPERLKNGWDLLLGSSTDVLPCLHKEMEGKVDIFIHDSDHTYENMTFELDKAWELLKNRGVIVCDNIDMNSAFADFCRKRELEPVCFPVPNSEYAENLRFAIVVKP